MAADRLAERTRPNGYSSLLEAVTGISPDPIPGCSELNGEDGGEVRDEDTDSTTVLFLEML